MINDSNASTGVLAFIQKLRFQDTPAAIEHGFGHPCLDELPGADIADDNILILIYDPPGELMQCVQAAPAGAPVQALCLPFVSATLRLGYLGFKTSIELARGELLPIARDRRILEPEIDPDRT